MKVRLNERQLHSVIKESVKAVLNEAGYYRDNYPDGQEYVDLSNVPTEELEEELARRLSFRDPRFQFGDDCIDAYKEELASRRGE